MDSELLKKKCISSEEGVNALSLIQVNDFLLKVDEWDLEENLDIIKISKEYRFENFNEAINFINKFSEVCEEQAHHPDILIHDYNHVRITFYTHSVKGLSENDFIMAAKCDGVLMNLQREA